MVPQVPIQIARIERLGLHHRYARLMVVRVVLEPKPSLRWRTLFVRTGVLLGHTPSVFDSVRDDVLMLAVPEADSEPTLAEVRERVQIANASAKAEHASGEFPTEPKSRMLAPTHRRSP